MRWDPKTTIVLAILAVAVIVVLIQAAVGPRRDAGGDDEAGFKDRCAAANGIVHGRGNDRTCVAADGSVIKLP